MSYGQLIIITLCFSMDINALRAKNIEANKKKLPVGHQYQ